MTVPIVAPIPGKVAQVFFNPDGTYRKSRYKALYGGRGSGKSESIARLLVGEARRMDGRILCSRQYQNSIKDSVHKQIEDAARAMGVVNEFRVLDHTIIHRRTGAEFIFKGLARSIGEIKSMKGIRRVWVEEAEPVPKETWDVLDPTVRETDSEIWISYNPDQPDSATHKMCATEPGPDMISALVNWRDNPWFPENPLGRLRRRCLEADQDAYDWIWEGKTRKVTKAIIFRDKITVREFNPPPDVIWRLGADWGFADDPCAFVASYVTEDADGGETLWIRYTAGGYHIDLERLAGTMADIPVAKEWPWKADNSQPMTISYVGRQGLNISGAEKWPGSVEDGITHLKGFRRIYVHPSCTPILEEFRLYSYKTDPKQLDENGDPQVLPIIVDKFNHWIDALRYSLDGYIQGRGGLGAWKRLYEGG